MQPHPDIDAAGTGTGTQKAWTEDDDETDAVRPPRAFHARALVVLWPAFMMAAVLEALVFSVVDPTGLHGIGTALLSWPATAVYSLAFLVFWVVIAAAAAITMWLDRPGPWQST
jgi:hypothetical protein